MEMETLTNILMKHVINVLTVNGRRSPKTVTVIKKFHYRLTFSRLIPFL